MAQWNGSKASFASRLNVNGFRLRPCIGFLRWKRIGRRAFRAKPLSGHPTIRCVSSHGGDQIGFARVISGRATIAYLGDVFVLTKYRRSGLSKWFMKRVMSHPELQGLRRWILLTGDAQGLYAQSGFTSLTEPDQWMQRHDAAVYLP